MLYMLSFLNPNYLTRYFIFRIIFMVYRFHKLFKYDYKNVHQFIQLPNMLPTLSIYP